MWRPPERIRYEATNGRVPSREGAANSRLFFANPSWLGHARAAQLGPRDGAVAGHRGRLRYRRGRRLVPQYISDAHGPFGRNAQATASIRSAIRAAGLDTPIICAGDVHNFEMAEQLLADGTCDIVRAARQTLADPNWFRKIALGHGGDVRTCEFTNYCEGLDQKHNPVTCKLWDKLSLDAPGVLRSSDGKRRLIAPDWPPQDA